MATFRTPAERGKITPWWLKLLGEHPEKLGRKRVWLPKRVAQQEEATLEPMPKPILPLAFSQELDRLAEMGIIPKE